MTRLLLTLCICFVTLTDCTNNKLGQLMFDESKVELLIKYDYEFKSGKKTNTTQQIYTFISGNIADTITTKTFHIYNDKGLLVRELSYSDHKEKPDIKEFTYDQNDSLNLEVEIDSEGDTTYVAKYISYPDQNRSVFVKRISLKMDENSGFVTAFENKTKDTFLIKRDYVYEGLTCKHLDVYDKKDNLISREEFIYENGKIMKKIEYTFSKGLKMLNKTTYFDYSKNSQTPNLFSLNNKDTIDYEINELINGELVCKTLSYDNKNIENIEYYNKGKLIKVISKDKTMNRKIVNQMTYYDNGELKEEKSYGEKINTR